MVVKQDSNLPPCRAERLYRESSSAEDVYRIAMFRTKNTAVLGALGLAVCSL